jgi:hypothetical protein
MEDKQLKLKEKKDATSVVFVLLIEKTKTTTAIIIIALFW